MVARQTQIPQIFQIFSGHHTAFGLSSLLIHLSLITQHSPCLLSLFICLSCSSINPFCLVYFSYLILLLCFFLSYHFILHNWPIFLFKNLFYFYLECKPQTAAQEMQMKTIFSQNRSNNISFLCLFCQIRTFWKVGSGSGGKGPQLVKKLLLSHNLSCPTWWFQ